MRKYNDPLYGIIELSDVIKTLMHEPSVRYLKDRKQLGFVSEVFHCAESSRFPHVIGVAYVLGLMGKTLNLPEETIRLIEAGGMLHDPHFPYSHPTDVGLGIRHEDVMQDALRSGKRVGMIHGEALCEVLHSLGINPIVLADFLAGEHPLSRLINHPIVDADKIDYVPRDQHTASLTRTETMRIVKELLLIDGEVGVDHGAEPNVRDLLSGRSVSFDKMYAHPRVHAAETMFSYALNHDRRIRDNPQQAREMIHCMNEKELLRYLKQSPDSLPRLFAERLQAGEPHFYHHVYVEGGSSSLPVLRSLLSKRDEIQSSLFAQGMLCSFYLAQKAVDRHDAPRLPHFSIRMGDVVNDLFEQNSPARADYLHVPRFSFVVYAEEDSMKSRETAKAIVGEFLR